MFFVEDPMRMVLRGCDSRSRPRGLFLIVGLAGRSWLFTATYTLMRTYCMDSDQNCPIARQTSDPFEYSG